MKKFAALAVLAAVSASASAQSSSLTMFGVLDADVGSVNNGHGAIRSVGNSGNESSRLGFRGTEDLGGGLRAGFWLEGQILSDQGLGTSAGGLNFQRRSTISLISDSLGEVRLGRDLTPSYTTRLDFDPFGANGVGSHLNMFGLNTPIQVIDNSPGATAPNGTPLGSGAQSLTRSSNSVEYFLPANLANLAGVYGNVMAAAGEGAQPSATTPAAGRYIAGRLGYRAGPLNVALEYGKTTLVGLGAQDLKEALAGASYDFGVVRVMGAYNKYTYDKVGGAASQKNWLLGATAPIGSQGTVKLAYNKVTIDGTTTVTGLGAGSAHMWSAGYVYDLSKRTALYASYSRISNSSGTEFTVGGQQNGPQILPATGLSSSGYEVGVRHRF